jgi:hypothetical protein
MKSQKASLEGKIKISEEIIRIMQNKIGQLDKHIKDPEDELAQPTWRSAVWGPE